jgi:hypothetical protein
VLPPTGTTPAPKRKRAHGASSASPDAQEDSTTAVTPMDLDDLGASSPMDLDDPDPATPTAPGSKGKRRKKKGAQARRSANRETRDKKRQR